MIRGLVDFALKSRWLVLGAVAVLTVWGILSFRALPIEAYPDVANNYVQIITQWPGRSAEEIERQVTVPIEIQVAGIPRLAHLADAARQRYSEQIQKHRLYVAENGQDLPESGILSGIDAWDTCIIAMQSGGPLAAIAGAPKPNVAKLTTTSIRHNRVMARTNPIGTISHKIRRARNSRS